MDLGNLYFNLGIKDQTSADVAKIKQQLDKALVIEPVIKKASIQKAIADLNKTRQQFKLKLDADLTSTSLRTAISNLQKSGRLKVMLNADINPASLNKAVRALQKQMPNLSLKLNINNNVINQLAKDIALLNKNLQQYNASAGNATRNTNQQTAAMQRQSVVAGQLSGFVAQYFSIYGAQRLLSSIIEIGGAFETQRIALRSIIGDVQKADTIFSQIKKLAIESPFSFLDLTSYTKQLTAFSIPYNELYDTTKRLADISAGLGVDMSRLILAYGQIRSASFLRGQEVRQLTESGVPIISELARKFSELEGHMVSAGEVFDRISKRGVPFEMVKEALWDMTNEGGKFYKMQEVLMESISGRMMKLKDSYQIMISEVADGSNKAIKSLIDVASWLISNWQSVGTVIMFAVGTYGALKVATAAATAIQATSIIQQYEMLNLSRAQLIADLELIQAVNGLTAAQARALAMAKSMQAGMSATAWGAIAAAIGIIAGLFVAWYNEANRLDNELNKLANKEADSAKNLVAEYQKLVDKLGTLKQGTNAYADVIKQINRQYGEYIGRNFSLAASYDEVKASVNGVTNAIYAMAKSNFISEGMKNVSEKFTDQASSAAESIKINMINFGLTNEDADIAVESLRQRIEDALSRKMPIDNRWIIEQVKGISDVLNKNITKAQQVRQGSTILNIMTDNANSLIRAYEMVAAKQADMQRKADIMFRPGQGMDVESTKQIDAIKLKYKKLYDSMESGADQTGTKVKELNEILKVYEKVSYAEGIRQTKEELASLTKATEDWIATALKFAKESKNVAGENVTANMLVPLEAELSDQAAYYKRIMEFKNKLEEGIKEKQSITEQQGQTTSNDLQKELYQLQQINKAIKVLKIDRNVFGKSTSGGGVAADPIAERAKTQIDLWNQAMEAYKKYAAEIGSTAAIQKVRADVRFSAIDFNPETYKAELEKLNATLSDSKEAQSLRQTILSRFTDMDVEDLKKAVDNLMKEFEREISGLSKKYNLYESLKESAGENIAGKLIFGDGAEITSYIEEYAKRIKSIFESMGITVSFDIDSEKSVRDQIGNMYDQLSDAQKKHIDTIDSLREEANQKELERMAKLLSERKKSYAEQYAEVDKLYDPLIAKAEGEVKAAFEEAKKAEISKIAADEILNDPTFIKLLGDVENYSTKSIKLWIQQAKKVISESDKLTVANKRSLVKNLEKATNEIIKRNPFTALKEAYIDYYKTLKSGGDADIEEAWANVANSAKEAVKAFETLSSSLASLFESMNTGNDELSKTIAGVINFAKTAASAMYALSQATATSMSKVEKASIILTIISAAIQMLDQLDLEFVNANKQYKSYNEKVQLVNDMTRAVNEYKLAVLEAAKAEHQWFAKDNLRSLRDEAKINAQAFENYFAKLNEMQATYENEKAGGWLANLGRFTSKGYDETVNKVSEFIFRQFGGDKAGDISRDWTKRSGSMLFWGMTDYDIKNYGKALITARENLRYETRAKSSGILGMGGKAQKTENLEEWVRKNFGLELFNQEGWIDEKVAQKLLDEHSDKLVGETKKTLEFLMEQKEAYDKYMEEIQNYVSELYSPLVENFTSAIWDWFDTGKDALDSFREYAADTFRNIVNDAIRTIVIESIFADFQDKLKLLYKDYAEGKITEDELLNRAASYTADVMARANTQLPVIEDLLNNISDSIKTTTGIDIRKPEDSTSKQGLTAGIKGITEEQAGLLASYVNAIRADVAAMREAMYARADEILPMMNNTLALIQIDIMRIQENTLRNANAADAILSILNDATLGTRRLFVA